MKIKKSIACVSAALLASSAFVGCSGSSAGANGTINVFTCGDYIDPSLIKQFEKETGIKVNYDTYDTNETYLVYCGSGTANAENVKGRLQYFRDAIRVM